MTVIRGMELKWVSTGTGPASADVQGVALFKGGKGGGGGE